MNVRNPNVSLLENSTSGTPSIIEANSSYPIYSGFLSAHSYQVVSVGGAYTFGAATAGFTYSNVVFKGLGNLSSGPNPSGYKGSVHFNNSEVSLKYVVVPVLTVGIAYDYTKSSDISWSTGVNGGATYQLAVAGADYSLSKRTDVYLDGVIEKASGTDSRDLPAEASINNQAPAPETITRRRFASAYGIDSDSRLCKNQN